MNDKNWFDVNLPFHNIIKENNPHHSMFDLTINPVIVQLGPLAIRYYGLVYALGFLFAFWYLKHLIKNKQLKLSEKELDTFITYSIIGVVVGGRLGHFLFWDPTTIWTNPLEILMIWHGGMAFHGGAIGLAIAVWLFVKKKKIHFYELSDAIMIPAAFTLFLGRAVNFMNAEVCGHLWNGAWAVNLHNPPACDGYRHPSQLYEALKNLFMAGVLYIKKEHFARKKGYATWMFILMYGILRAFTNIWRDDVLWVFGVLSTGQLLSILMAIIALYVLITRYWNESNRV